jgi:hypothetical protein
VDSQAVAMVEILTKIYNIPYHATQLNSKTTLAKGSSGVGRKVLDVAIDNRK